MQKISRLNIITPAYRIVFVNADIFVILKRNQCATLINKLIIIHHSIINSFMQRKLDIYDSTNYFKFPDKCQNDRPLTRPDDIGFKIIAKIELEI